jgi:hypothetical protein
VSRPKARNSYANKSSSTFQGWVTIGGRRFYMRSMWEKNYGLYLQWLLDKGEISAWDYEPETFWFGGIKRGVASYLPDFKVTENSGKHVWHEVKGHMDARSKTKLKRMKRYYPHEKVIVIGAKEYYTLKSQVKNLVPGWK